MSTRDVVLKFGGTSVADADAIRRVARIVRRAGPLPTVVISALAGVTDRLLGIADLAAMGDRASAGDQIAALQARHVETATALCTGTRLDTLLRSIDDECRELDTLVRALASLREGSARSRDAIAACGELLSSRIVAAALEEVGLDTVWVDARQVVVTDELHTRALPLVAETRERLERLVRPLLAAGRIPVIGGFVGATREGVTTTLGRGGSDYSAAVIGAALDAREIQIWTDVDGMLSADPRVVPQPQLVPRLSFAEAAALAHFGAKVLHPSTIEPAVARNIPVVIRNSRRPQVAGTVITASAGRRRTPLAGLACSQHATLITATPAGAASQRGFLPRVCDVFDRLGAPIDLMAACDRRACFLVPERARPDAIGEALSAFAHVVSEPDLAVLAAVGDSLEIDVSLCGRVLAALHGRDVRVVSRGAGGPSIAVAIPQGELAAAMTALYERFFTDDADAGRPDDESLAMLTAAGAAATHAFAVPVIP